MTSPNWYDQEPYVYRRPLGVNPRAYKDVETGEEFIYEYNIPLIIEKAKEREKVTPKRIGLDLYDCSKDGTFLIFDRDNFCHHCGAKIDWS